MKIALVAQGRFWTFDLARALAARGHAVTIFTNYPSWAVRRYGVSAAQVRSLWPHGAMTRVTGWSPEAFLHIWFGRWAAAQLVRERWDVVHSWSGVSEELLKALAHTKTLRVLARGSTHIRTQTRILEEEAQRTRMRLDHPSPWMIAREEREYSLADRIAVLSRFAYETFAAEGIAREKLWVLPLGANVSAFRPSTATLDARCRRLLASEPLRLLYVGGLSLRKGLWDLAEAIKPLDPRQYRIRLVGARMPEIRPLLAQFGRRVEWIPSQPQGRLPSSYAWGDLFVFPTLEDGYGLVLAQALASALPIVTTPHCAGPDLLREGHSGWIVPIRSPAALTERIQWCHAHRLELAAMVRRMSEAYRPRDWAEVAADFDALCRPPPASSH